MTDSKEKFRNQAFVNLRKQNSKDLVSKLERGTLLGVSIEVAKEILYKRKQEGKFDGEIPGGYKSENSVPVEEVKAEPVNKPELKKSAAVKNKKVAVKKTVAKKTSSAVKETKTISSNKIIIDKPVEVIKKSIDKNPVGRPRVNFHGFKPTFKTDGSETVEFKQWGVDKVLTGVVVKSFAASRNKGTSWEEALHIRVGNKIHGKVASKVTRVSTSK